jgi:uncharacterized damage-inducible protein DinB
MNDRELYLSRLEAEFPAFQHVLEALPEDRLDYKPHERSPSASQLVWQLASGHKGLCDIVEKGSMRGDKEPAPDLDTMIGIFEQSWKRLQGLVARLDDQAWRKPGQLFFQGKLIMEKPTGEWLLFVLFDAIHHRGQLSAYIRPMGGKVPAIYGPSADERPK